MTVLIAQRFDLEGAACTYGRKLDDALRRVYKPGKDQFIRVHELGDCTNAELVKIENGSLHNPNQYDERHCIELFRDGHILVTDYFTHAAHAERLTKHARGPAQDILARTWSALEAVCEDQRDSLVCGGGVVHISGRDVDVQKAYGWFTKPHFVGCAEDFMDLKFPQARMGFGHVTEGVHPSRIEGDQYVATVLLSFDGDIRRKRKRA